MNTTQIVITIFHNRFPMDGFNLSLHQERNAFFVFVQINFHKDNLFFMKIEIIKLGVVTVGLVFTKILLFHSILTNDPIICSFS